MHASSRMTQGGQIKRGGRAKGGWGTDLLCKGSILLGLGEVGGLHPEALGVARGVHSLQP